MITETFLAKELSDKESKKLLRNIKKLYILKDKEGAQKALDKLNYIRKAEGKNNKELTLSWIMKTPTNKIASVLGSDGSSGWEDVLEKDSLVTSPFDKAKKKAREKNLSNAVSEIKNKTNTFKVGDKVSYNGTDTVIEKVSSVFDEYEIKMPHSVHDGKHYHKFMVVKSKELKKIPSKNKTNSF